MVGFCEWARMKTKPFDVDTIGPDRFGKTSHELGDEVKVELAKHPKLVRSLLRWFWHHMDTARYPNANGLTDGAGFICTLFPWPRGESFKRIAGELQEEWDTVTKAQEKP